MAKFQVYFLAYKVFEGIVKNQKGVEAIFLDYGLHTFPKKLNQKIQDHIESISDIQLVFAIY